MTMSFASPVLVTVGVLSQHPMNTNANKPILKYCMELMAGSLLIAGCGLDFLTIPPIA
jgi:hypothetical protein